LKVLGVPDMIRWFLKICDWIIEGYSFELFMVLLLISCNVVFSFKLKLNYFVNLTAGRRCTGMSFRMCVVVPERSLKRSLKVLEFESHRRRVLCINFSVLNAGK